MRKQHGSLSGYQTIQSLMYAMRGAGSFCGYTLFRQSFTSFLPSLRSRPDPKEPETKIVHCPKCKSRPEILICDGACAVASGAVAVMYIFVL